MTARTRRNSSSGDAKPGSTDEAGNANTADGDEQVGAMQGPGGATDEANADPAPESDRPAETTASPDADTTGGARKRGGGSDDGSDDSDDSDDSGVPYLNVSGGPIPYDRDGHAVDADAWTPPVNLDAIGQQARSRGYLKSRTALGL